MSDPPPREEPESAARRINWTMVVLVWAVVILALAVGYLLTRGNSDQDKLSAGEVAKSTPAPTHDKVCASSATYDVMKRDLFHRAGELRGSDQSEFDRLSGYAALRMENPVLEGEEAGSGAAHCSGFLSIDLPPGIAVAGGRRTVSAQVDYMVTAAADVGGPVVLLRNADPIISALATLGEVNQPAAPPPEGLVTSNEAAPAPPQAPVPPQPTSTPATATATPPATAAARPSFDCATARRPGEIAICGDPMLATLDRQMAAEYSRAAAAASPEQRDLLRETAHRFYDYRDRCQNDACIARAYAGRMREIRDIVEGRWSPPR